MSVNSAIELFAESMLTDLRENLKSKLAAKSKNGFSGDSRLGASIRIHYLQNGDFIFGFELYLADYYKWVNSGRSSGKGISQEGQEKLVKWIKSRGLTPSVSDLKKKQIKSFKNKTVKKAVKQISVDKKVKGMVFAISKKIKEKGYDANHFFDEVIHDGRVQKFQSYLKEQYRIDLQLQIIEPLKAA